MENGIERRLQERNLRLLFLVRMGLGMQLRGTRFSEKDNKT